MISRLFISLLLMIAGTMGVLAPNSQTPGLFGYSAPYIITGGSSSSSNSFTATTTFSDNIPLVFGTDSDFEIKYKTTGLTDVGLLTVPTSSNILTIIGDDFADYDYFNAAISAPDPLLAFFAASSTRNRYGIINQGNNNPYFYFSASDGDDVDGTARNSNGNGIYLGTGNGGTLGGVTNGGDMRVVLGTGAGGGIDGYIWSANGNDADMRFKNNGTGVFRVGDSNSEAALTLDHDGTSAVVSSTIGNIILGTTKTAVGAYFVPTYSLDVYGDQRVSATGTQQLVYSNASGTEGLNGVRSYVAPSSGTMNWKNFLGVIDQQNAKTSGLSSIFSGQVSVNGSDSGGTYTVFEAQSQTASLATQNGITIGSGFDYAINSASGKVSFTNTIGTNGEVGVLDEISSSLATGNQYAHRINFTQSTPLTSGLRSVWYIQPAVNISDTGGTYNSITIGSINTSVSTTSVGVSIGDGYDYVFEVQADNTGNATAAIGRIPILVGGSLRYIRYYAD